MFLWLVFATLTAAALAAVLSPFLRTPRAASSPAAHDVAIYRDQLLEVDRDLERGLIGDSEAQSARTEIARRLLAANDAAQTSRSFSPTRASALVTATVALICLPGLSLALYLHLGSPSLPDQPLSARLQAPVDTQDIAGLVARVEARLREHPEDGEGWEVIAPVYLRQGRHQDAADAFARALRLLGETPARLEAYGVTLVLANNGVVTEDARRALDKALAKDASLIKARFWTTMAKEQDGRFEDAAAGWREMLRQAGPNAPWRGMVEERLRLAESRINKPPPKGPSADDIAAAQQMTAQDRAAMISQMVENLASRLAQDSNDLEGWLRLVRSYMVLERKDDAAKALREARTKMAGNVQALAQLDGLARELGL